MTGIGVYSAVNENERMYKRKKNGNIPVHVVYCPIYLSVSRKVSEYAM